jgi:hypothetical protein
MSSGRGGEPSETWYLPTVPEDRVTDETDPATARVMGVDLTDEYDLAHDWLDSQLRPAAERITLKSVGDGVQHSAAIDDEMRSELDRGLSAMGTFPDDYDTPADMLGEFAARKYSLARWVTDRLRQFDAAFKQCKRTLTRYARQDTRQEKEAVVLPLGRQLLALGVYLYGQYDTGQPSTLDDDQLPAKPNAGRIDAVRTVLIAYHEALPPTDAAGDHVQPPPEPLDGIAEARQELAVVAVTVAYARWEATVEDAWPFEWDRYPVTFDDASPQTGMVSLTEYTTEGIRNDVRGFDDTLSEIGERLCDGTYLKWYRSVANRYLEALQQLGGG